MEPVRRVAGRMAPLDQRDLVEPLEEALAGEGVDVEAILDSLAAHHLTLQVDHDLRRRVFRDQVDQVPHLRVGQRHRQQPGLVAVGPEDVGEARRDDGLEPGVAQRPGRVLAG